MRIHAESFMASMASLFILIGAIVLLFSTYRLAITLYRNFGELPTWRETLSNAAEKVPVMEVEIVRKELLRGTIPEKSLLERQNDVLLTKVSRIVREGKPVDRWRMLKENGKVWVEMYRLELYNSALAQDLGTSSVGIGVDSVNRVALIALYPSSSTGCALGQGEMLWEIYHYQDTNTLQPYSAQRELLRPSGGKQSTVAYSERLYLLWR